MTTMMTTRTYKQAATMPGQADAFERTACSIISQAVSSYAEAEDNQTFSPHSDLPVHASPDLYWRLAGAGAPGFVEHAHQCLDWYFEREAQAYKTRRYLVWWEYSDEAQDGLPMNENKLQSEAYNNLFKLELDTIVAHKWLDEQGWQRVISRRREKDED